MCKSEFLCLMYTDVTAEELFRVSDDKESLYERLQRLLSEILQTDLDKVHIFSLANGSHSNQQHLSLWFAAHGSPYYKPERLHGSVAVHKAKVTIIPHRHIHTQFVFYTAQTRKHRQLLTYYTCTWRDNLHEVL